LVIPTLGFERAILRVAKVLDHDTTATIQDHQRQKRVTGRVRSGSEEFASLYIRHLLKEDPMGFVHDLAASRI